MWHLHNLTRKFISNPVIVTLVALLTFRKLSRFFEKYIKLVILLLIIFILYAFFNNIYTFEQIILMLGGSFRRTMVIMLIFPLLRIVIDLYEDRTVRKATPFAHWMFIGILIA
jgi:hypothetical protein